MTAEQQILLCLVNLGIGTLKASDCCAADRTPVTPGRINWREIIRLAVEHGVNAIIVDGMNNLGEGGDSSVVPDIPDCDKFELYGRAVTCESLYEKHAKAIAGLVGFYEKHGFPMMLLKGLGLSLNYPVPGHRPVGDIDIYLFGHWKECDNLLRSRGKKVDNSHHHHSVFTIKGITVENHYDFLNLYAHRSSARMERDLRTLLKEHPCVEAEINGRKVLLPPPDFNALFQICHNAGHFVSTGLTIRMLLDWLLFVRKEGEKVDWDGIYAVLRREKMDRFANVLNSIGIRYFNLPEKIFPALEQDGALVERVWNDILTPECTVREDGNPLRALWVKPLRRWRNRWKYALCYPEGFAASSLWTIRGKLLKPAHFFK